jgi:ABC-type nitrate/sulfonate/bicarbonate transport system substrate-binding protein
MGAEIAVRNGIGTVVLDVRRGDAPPASWYYTFPALVTTENHLRQAPERVAAAMRAVRQAQKALQADPSCATEAARRRFPPNETGLIAELVKRDLPYYDPTISAQVVTQLNHFAQNVGLLSAPVPYEQVVAVQFSHLWES